MVKRIIDKICREAAIFFGKNGYNHFVTRRWNDFDDLDILEEFFRTEYTNNPIRLVPPNLKNYHKVIVISPHQDDETIGAGGLLCKLDKLGADISIIYTTDGKEVNPLARIDEISERRFREVDQSLKKIKHEIFKLNVCNMKLDITYDQVGDMTRIIDTIKPDLILVPWLLDTPVKHRLANHILQLACKKLVLTNTEIWGYQVHNHIFPNVGIDITEEIDQKITMLKEFKSQKFKNFHHTIVGLNAYNSKHLIDSFYTELFFGLESRKYLDLVDRLYTNKIERIYKGDAQVIRSIKALLADKK